MTKGKPRHPQNIEIYNELTQQVLEYECMKRINSVACIKKVLRTLEKYPLPLISPFQVIKLEGVGDKLLETITKVIVQKYGKYDLTSSVETFNMKKEHSQPIPELSLTQGKKVKTKEETMSEEKKKTKMMKITNVDSQFLTSLYLQQKENEDRNFYTKEEVSKVSQENPFFEGKGELKINKRLLNKLEGTNMISKFNFNNEEKYSLTEDGTQLAKSYLDDFENGKAFKIIKKEYSQPLSVKKKRTDRLTSPLELDQNDIDNYSICLYIDDREKKSQNLNYFEDSLKHYKINVKRRKLPLADFCWVCDVKLKTGEEYRYILDYLIERKTVTDLLSSLLDGRYKDQRKRLIQSDIDNLYYLIEGDMNKDGDFSGIKQSINETRTCGNFNVVNTRDAKTTTNFILKLHRKVESRQAKFMNSKKIRFNKSYDDFEKKENKICQSTLKSILFSSLIGIKGFGEQVVNRIIHYYPSFNHLYCDCNNMEKREEVESILSSFMSQTQIDTLFDLFTRSNYN